MKTYGIICEYNPFHNGHIYQIEETKKQTGADHIVAIMSGNFVQRGDTAIIDKFKRAEIAVNNGVDLVIEMPVQYSLSSAEYFARAGVMMLKGLRCVNGISFGSECGNIEDLQRCADAIDTVSTKENVKPLLEQGMSYPEAVNQLVNYQFGPLTGDLLKSPNNTLAVEYLRAIKALGIDDMEPFTVKRKGAEHDGEPVDNIASASYIRQLIDDGEDYAKYVPEDMAAAIEQYDDNDSLAWFSNLERPLLYRLRTIAVPDLHETAGIGQGLENRVFGAGHSANDLDTLINMIKSKRYTEARVRRLLLNTLIGIKHEDLKVPPIFGRILALNDRGAEIVKMAGALPENKCSIPFSTSIKDVAKTNNPKIKRSIALNNLATDVYGLASRSPAPCGKDFTTNIKLQKIEGFVSELPEDLKTTSKTPDSMKAEAENTKPEAENAKAETENAEAETKAEE